MNLFLKLFCHMVDGGADILKFPDGEIRTPRIQAAFFHRLQHGLDTMYRHLDPAVISPEEEICDADGNQETDDTDEHERCKLLYDIRSRKQHVDSQRVVLQGL